MNILGLISQLIGIKTLRLTITFLFVVQFKCVTRRFDRADRITHLKLFLDQSDVPRKIGSKP